jgi:hypothetical protein
MAASTASVEEWADALSAPDVADDECCDDAHRKIPLSKCPVGHHTSGKSMAVQYRRALTFIDRQAI